MKFAILRLFRRFGFDVQRYGPYRDHHLRLRYALDRQRVTTLLDVGANVGQFGQFIRIAGYQQRIISFEPLSDAHRKLQAVAATDPKWTVANRCAVGSENGRTEIQIAGNSQSSSILDIKDRHVAADTRSGYIGKEAVEVVTLDSYLDRVTDSALGLKIDTQGYESMVLAGLRRHSARVKVIQCEMSLVPLYEGATTFRDLFLELDQRGYRCISIEAGFTDPRTFEVLQVDGIFERT